jgi:hypothetical protein
MVPRILTFMLCLSILSFALACHDPESPTRDAVPGPTLIPKGDRYVYIPPDGSVITYDRPEDSEDDTEKELVCDIDEIFHTTDPEIVETRLITFVEDVIDIERQMDPRYLRSDTVFVHLKRVDIKALSGDSLQFLEWIRLSVSDGEEDIEVAWRAGFPNTFVESLLLDQSVNLVSYLRDGADLKGRVRASAPKHDTWLQADMSFLKVFNCNWE